MSFSELVSGKKISIVTFIPTSNVSLMHSTYFLKYLKHDDFLLFPISSMYQSATIATNDINPLQRNLILNVAVVAWLSCLIASTGKNNPCSSPVTLLGSKIRRFVRHRIPHFE